MASKAKLTVPPRIVRDVADALAVALDDTAEQKLTAWLDELVRWNATHDLTAARSSDELADAFVLAQSVARDARVVDVGSGAGAPGLPLALLRPDLKVTLVEPLQKRVAFMRGVLAKVERLDISLQNARSEALPTHAWQIALSRATLPPPAWLPAGAALVESGGEVVVLLAQDSPPRAPNATIIETRSYEWPRTHAARTIVRYRIA